MTLVGAHVGQLGTQLQSPCNGTAIVAHMTCILRIFHGGQMLFDHVGIAAKTIAGQDHGVARQTAGSSIRLGEVKAVNKALGIRIQPGHLGLRQYHHTR